MHIPFTLRLVSLRSITLLELKRQERLNKGLTQIIIVMNIALLWTSLRYNVPDNLVQTKNIL